MGDDKPIASRRPLKSRSTRWAAVAAQIAIRLGLTANQISFIGIVVAAAGAWALVEAPKQPWLFLMAAACIQLRLLANLLDGMVAVEGGRGGPTGAIWNEFPDRIEDSLLLIAFGYAAGSFGYEIGRFAVGLLAALLAAICAYVRLLGATLGQPQDFGGPMAKPHRMAALTIGCLLAAATTAVLPYDIGRGDIVPAMGNVAVFAVLNGTLGLVVIGTVATIALRLRRLSKALRG
jgi:phosphatidylglycerophosphate synthase